MRKKLITLISALCILSGMISVSSAADLTDVTDSPKSVAINTICGLGIMEETEYGIFSPDNLVTRGEAAVAVGKLMKYDWDNGTETSFTDIPQGADELVYINTLKSMGIMIGYSETYFGYEEAVTLEQVETILLRATGYMALADVMSRGHMLSQADFLDGVTGSVSDKITRADMAQILYNCLETKEISFDHEGSYYQDKTVLENRQGLKKISGVMTANSTTRLSSTGGTDKGKIEIDSVEYATTYAQADSLLGYPVVAYTEIENDNIVYMYANPSRHTVTEVFDYDIVDIKTDGANITLKYEENSKPKTEVFNINDNIMYNGTAVSELNNEMLDINMGKIKIIELSSGVRNVFIESYVNYIVEYINTHDKTILDKLTGQTLSFDEDNTRFYKFGFETTFDQIRAGEVLSIYDNNDSASRNISVHISDDKETGKITGFEDNLVYINGKSYRTAVGVDLTGYMGKFAGPFYIDASGRIVAVDKQNNTEIQYGCLVKILYDEELAQSVSNEKSCVTFKILSATGQIIEYPAASKLRINNIKVYEDWENFPFDLFKKNGEYFNQVIKFQVNYEGKVSSIYTEEEQQYEENSDGKWTPIYPEDAQSGPQIYMPVPYTGKSEADNYKPGELHARRDENGFIEYRYRPKSNGMFSNAGDSMRQRISPGFFVEPTTVIFSVPSKYSGKDEDYKVISMSAFRDQNVYNSKVYDVNEYSVAKALMITASSKVTPEKTIMGVNNVVKMVNSEDEIVQKIKVISDNKITEYELLNSVDTPIQKGDMIQISVDEKGRVNAVEVLGNAEEMSVNPTDDDFHYVYSSGIISGVSGDYLKMYFPNNRTKEFTDYLTVKLTGATQFYIYNKDKKQFEVANRNSITFGCKALVQIHTGSAITVFMADE